MKHTTSARSLLFCTALLAIEGSAQAQISTRLSDTVNKGRGTIDLLKNMSAAQFQQQVSTNGNLFFAMDVNEDMAGNENRASAGVALERVELVVKTSTGSYKFTNFSTNTSTMLKGGGDDGGKDSKSYYTVFGQAGSSDLTSATKSFDLGSFDDVIALTNVKFEGKVLSAQMDLRLLDTSNSQDANGSFFDFSGGFEDMALLSPVDAHNLEKANIGMSSVPKTVTFALDAPVVTAADIVTTPAPAPVADTPPVTETPPKTDSPPTTVDAQPASGTTPAAPPAAPLPPLAMIILLVAGLGAYNAFHKGGDHQISRE